MPLPAGTGLKNIWHMQQLIELTCLLSLNCCLNPVWFTRSNYLNPKRSECVSKQSKPHTMQTVQKFSKQHPSWLWNVMLFKPCFSWKRCKHRKPCPVRRSTHAGASAGGGDGVPFAEPKKTFAGQQGLHSSVAAGRLGSRWNLPAFTPPCLCCSKALNIFKLGSSNRPRPKCKSGRRNRLPAKQRHCQVALQGLKG